MNSKNRGFTLIELLIVVLIIAILAAIALPQYQKAVMKSRYSAMMPIVKSLSTGNEAYYMEKGEYALSPTELDVAGQSEKYPDGTKVTMNQGEYSYVLAKRDNLPNSYIMYQKHSVQFPGEIHCEADANDTKAQDVCKSFGATKDIGTTITPTYLTYVLQGAGNGVAPIGDDNDELGDDSGDDPSTNTEPEPECSDPEPTYTITRGKFSGPGQRGGSVSPGEWSCVNGQWQLSSFSSTLYVSSYNTQCTDFYEYEKPGAPNGGACSGTYTNGAKCQAYQAYNCSNSTFTGSDRLSGCEAVTRSDVPGHTGEYGCAYSTFNESSVCWSYAENGCYGSTFNSGSICLSRVAGGCAGAIIKAGAKCQVTSPGGCEGAIFEEGSCCDRKNYNASYCPAGVPICS